MSPPQLFRHVLQVLQGMVLLACLAPMAWGQVGNASAADLRVAREDEDLVLHAQIAVELPAAVEDALQKGVALFFVTEAEINRDRWYWYDKKLAQRSRHYKLLYQPLIRKWRLYVSADNNQLYEPGMTLPQTFDRLPDALSAIGRSNSWRLMSLADIEPDSRYTLGFRFKLDTAALPKPLQIGLIGQSDWSLSTSKTLRFTLESLK